MSDTNPPTPSKTSDFNLKELVTAAIGLAIVTLMLVFLWQGFKAGKGLEENQKYIIGIMLSLAGTVTGYYFGRVPAEKHADTAQRAADTAQQAKVQADAKVEDAKKTLDRILPGPTAARALDVMKADDMPTNDSQQELADLRRRL